jgi:hypothetical protein
LNLPRQEAAGGWRNCILRKIYNLYASLNIIRVIKSRRMGWSRQVAHMGELGSAYKIIVGKPKGKNHSEDLGVDGKIIL